MPPEPRVILTSRLFFCIVDIILVYLYKRWIFVPERVERCSNDKPRFVLFALPLLTVDVGRCVHGRGLRGRRLADWESCAVYIVVQLHHHMLHASGSKLSTGFYNKFDDQLIIVHVPYGT